MATEKLKTIGLLHLDNIDLEQWRALENRDITYFDLTGQVEKISGETGTLKFRVNFATCDSNNYIQPKNDSDLMTQMSKDLCVFFLNQKINTMWFLLASIGVNNPKLAMIMHVPGINFTAYTIETKNQIRKESTNEVDPDMLEAMLKRLKFKGPSPFSA